MLQPKLTQRRLNIDDRDVLTADEVAELPEGTLAVVLDRRPGQDASDFRYRLLKLVMERSGQPHVLGLSAVVQPQDEAIAALAAGRDQVGGNPHRLSVGVYGAGRDLHQRLTSDRDPRHGWSVGVASWLDQSGGSADLKTVDRVGDLRRFTLLQGLGWSDVDVFDRLDCAPTRRDRRNFSDLWTTIVFSCFPVVWLNWLLKLSSCSDVAPQTLLDPHLLMAYPFAGFFYVSPSNKPLAEAIRRGFEQAISDGSYQRLLEEVIMTPWLKKNLSSRKVLVLSNHEAQTFWRVDPRHWMIPW